MGAPKIVELRPFGPCAGLAERLFLSEKTVGHHVSSILRKSGEPSRWSVTIDDVAKAHAADLQTQGEHDVRYLRYWVDEQHGKIFCLVDAPDAEAANMVHREAHGLVADEIFPVSEGA